MPHNEVNSSDRAKRRTSRLSLVLSLATLVGCRAPNETILCPESSNVCDISEQRTAPLDPAWTWTDGASEVVDEASSLFDGYRVIPIVLTVEDNTWRTLHRKAIERDATRTYSEAHVTIDGANVGVIGVRAKGGQGTLASCFDEEGNQVCDKLSYKLKFSEFDKKHRFLGLSRLNLHSAVRDKSLMRDYLAYGLFRRMGVKASRVGYAQLFVNGEFLGLYVMIEQVDKRFLESRFPGYSSGNLYKGAWPSAYLGTNNTSLLRTNRSAANHGSLEQFGSDLIAANDEQLPHVVEQWMNPQTLDNFVAVDQAIINWDGPLSFRFHPGQTDRYRSYNFYLYQPTSERAELIPWDMDNSFAREHRGYAAMPSSHDLSVDCATDGIVHADAIDRDYLVPSCDPLIRGLALYPNHGAATQLQAGPFLLAEILATVERYRTLIAESVMMDPALSVTQWTTRVDRLKDNIKFLHDRLVKSSPAPPSE